jgi:hypothetical protein
MITSCRCLQTVVCKVSGVTCSIEHLAAAEVAPTATACARALLLGFFAMEVLLRSSKNGDKNRIDKAADVRPALDPTKLRVLYGKLTSLCLY